MGATEGGSRPGADRPARKRDLQDAADLRERVRRLEAHVAGLEHALEMMGWTQRTDYSLPHPPAPTPPATVAPPAPATVEAPLTSRRSPRLKPPIDQPSPIDQPPPAQGFEPPRPGWYTFPEPQQGSLASAESTIDPFGYLTRLGPAKILALVGGGALLLGMAYFLSLAFSRGWITPEMRVALGMLVGFALLPAGALLFDRDRPTLGHVLVAVGLGTIDLALFGSRLYNLVLPEAAMVGALVAALAAGYIAVRWNSQLVAGMGIAAVLAAPPIVGAPPTFVTVAFLAAVMVGVAYVAFRRDWEWLPWLSFALTAPQILVWLAPGSQPAPLVMVVLGGYWVLFAVSAVMPVLAGSPRPLPTPVALLGAVGAFVTVAVYAGLANPWLRGEFVGLLSLANLLTGIGLMRRRGFADDLTQTALGLAVALYVVSVALAFEGPAVPIAWTLAMVACAWVWSRFGDIRAGYAALVTGLLAGSHVLVLEYIGNYAIHPQQDIPYADPEGAALLVLLLGLAATAWLSRRAIVAQAIAATAVVLVAITVPFEAFDLAPRFQGPMIMLGLSALALFALALDRARNRAWRLNLMDQPLTVAGAVVGSAALLHLGVNYGLLNLLSFAPAPATPFADERSLMALAAVVGIWVIAATRIEIVERTAMLCLSALIAAALFRQQLPLEWAVVGWSVLAVLALIGAPTGWTLAERRTQIVYTTAGILLGAAALAALVIAPPSRWTVPGSMNLMPTAPPNAATVSLAALAVGLFVATWREERTLGTRRLGIGVLAVIVYGLSVGLVDSFAARVPDANAIEEIGKQAQVALTILWAVIGLGLLGYGLVRESLAGRGAGLALLGIATVKAFVYDLAALDVAYRVLSLVGLGLLLLAGAYAYQRLRARSGPGGAASAAH